MVPRKSPARLSPDRDGGAEERQPFAKGLELAQRRHREGQVGKAKVEVPPEAVCGHSFVQVGVGGGQHLHIQKFARFSALLRLEYSAPEG